MPGQLLYVREDMLVPAGPVGDDALVPQVREVWYEPEGMITVRDELDGKPFTGPKGEGQATMTAAERADFAQLGPGLRYPTPAWLAGLSSDSDALLTQLGVRAPQDTDSAATLWETCTSLMIRVDPLLPTGVRAALLGLMARAGGVTVIDVTFDGRRVFGLRQGSRNSGYLLLLDPQTGRVVGRLAVGPGSAGATPSPGTTSPRPAPSGGRIQQQWLYTYQIVPA
jgi:hypothetical protein